jgi:hypothetical protein
MAESLYAVGDIHGRHDLLTAALDAIERHAAGDPATVIFHNVMNYQTDLRAEYRYEHNDSNNPVRDYKNHIVNLMLVARF